MNPLNAQTELIDQLYHLVYSSAPNGFTKAACRFQYSESSDGSRSVDEQFWYECNHEREAALLNYLADREKRPITLVPKLHALMKAHTGGDWNAFTLAIDKDGRVTTKFEYPDQDGKRPASPV